MENIHTCERFTNETNLTRVSKYLDKNRREEYTNRLQEITKNMNKRCSNIDVLFYKNKNIILS